MKKYIVPELTVLSLTQEDILTLSTLSVYSVNNGKDDSEDFGDFHRMF